MTAVLPDHTDSENAAAPRASFRMPAFETRVTLYVLTGMAAGLTCLRAFTWYPGQGLSFDTPYHITMADLFGQLAWKRTFPPTAQSIWATCFADKELGFHLLLASIRRWAGLFGYRGTTPPFFLETGILVGALVLTFWVVLRTMKVRQPFLFLPLLLFSCPLFTLRVNMVRPHVISIILMMLTAAVLLERHDAGPTARRLVFLGFLFSYFHSNPHFILLPAGTYALVTLPQRGWRAFLAPAAALTGVFLGLLIHPQFPNTFIIWKIQCVDVIVQSLTHHIPDLSTPIEFLPPTLEHLGHNIVLLLLPALPIGMAIQRRRNGQRWPLESRYLLALTLISIGGYFLSKRMIEYALPFSLMAAADAYRRTWGQRPTRFHLGCLAGIVVLCLALVPVQKRYFSETTIVIPRSFAAWMRAHLYPGTRVANMRWDDFPPLFFAAPEYIYSYGLDPMFAYAADPERTLRIERINQGKEPIPPPAELARLVGSRFLFLGNRHAKFVQAMAKQHMALAYQGVDGWCFDLLAPTADHPKKP